MKIYTKAGDKGQTTLVGGTPVSKIDSRVALYGLLDDLNSKLGFAISLLDPEFSSMKCSLEELQQVLFKLQSIAACEPGNRKKFGIDDINPESVELLEKKIDQMQQNLVELKQFILPGGEPAAAFLHVCRTAARTVERELIKVSHTESDYFSYNVLSFVNRMSDFLFVAARFINQESGREEVFWKK